MSVKIKRLVYELSHLSVKEVWDLTIELKKLEKIGNYTAAGISQYYAYLNTSKALPDIKSDAERQPKPTPKELREVY
jgi:hypothetical protein